MTLKSGLFFFFLALSLIIVYPATGQWERTNWPYDDNDSAATCIALNGTNLFAGSNGAGIFLSTDNGSSWDSVNTGLTNTYINTFAVSGTDLFAGTAGYLGGNVDEGTGGIFLSTDSGKSWTAMNNGIGNTVIYALAVSGNNLFAGTSSDADNFGGVFYSSDSGGSWNAINNSLPEFDVGPEGVVALAVNDTFVFAAPEGGGFPQGIVFRSSNNGTTWMSVDSGLPGPSFATVQSFAVSGSNIFAALGDEVFISTNNGLTWIFSDSGFKSYVLTFAAIGTNLFAGTYDNGVFLSRDSGATWNAVNLGLTDPFITSLAFNEQYLFAGTVNNGVWRRLISEMINTSSVGTTATTEESITAYPNPFSQSSTITFSCAESGVGEVTIVNLLGAEVARLFSGELGAGEHSFEWDAISAPAGMYECVVRAGGAMQRIPILHY